MEGAVQGENLDQTLTNLIEVLFARERLSTDPRIAQYLLNVGSVPVQVLLSYNEISALTQDEKVLCKALRKSEKLSFDEEKMEIRPKEKLTQRKTIILRNIPSTTSIDQIKELFGQKKEVLDAIDKMNPDIGDTYFIQFKSEDVTLEAWEHLLNQKFDGQPVKARIKSEQLLKSYVDSPQSYSNNYETNEYYSDGYDSNTRSNYQYNSAQKNDDKRYDNYKNSRGGRSGYNGGRGRKKDYRGGRSGYNGNREDSPKLESKGPSRGSPKTRSRGGRSPNENNTRKSNLPLSISPNNFPPLPTNGNESRVTESINKTKPISDGNGSNSKNVENHYGGIESNGEKISSNNVSEKLEYKPPVWPNIDSSSVKKPPSIDQENKTPKQQKNPQAKNKKQTTTNSEENLSKTQTNQNQNNTSPSTEINSNKPSYLQAAKNKGSNNSN